MKHLLISFEIILIRYKNVNRLFNTRGVAPPTPFNLTCTANYCKEMHICNKNKKAKEKMMTSNLFNNK